MPLVPRSMYRAPCIYGYVGDSSHRNTRNLPASLSEMHEVVPKNEETQRPGYDRLNFGLRDPRLRLLTFRSIDLLMFMPMF